MAKCPARAKKHSVQLGGLICVPRVHKHGTAGHGTRYIYPRKGTHLCFDPNRPRKGKRK